MGFLCIATGLFTLLLALTEGQDWGWTSYKVLILLTVGVLSLALFVIVELEVDKPLLDVRVFRYWPFTNSLLLISVLSVGLFSVLFYVPLFLQQAQGLGAFEAGLLLLPQALVMAVCMPIAGRHLRPLRPALARGRSGCRSTRGAPTRCTCSPSTPPTRTWSGCSACARSAWAWA